ncbi:MAG: sigma-54-dependent Fis family transcriptional regulator [Chromatiales bacterium]|nr:sigma-54-dependent Fis family transcriptional regulator [Chromatiales bacterium]
MKSLKVLIVDDELAIRQLLSVQLERIGHQTADVGDGAGALKALSASDYDVCLCDIRLPDIEGIEVLRSARGQGVDTTFLMMTAFGSVSSCIEAMKLGAFDYLIKPLRPDDVAHRLKQIIDMDNLRSENRRLRSLVSERSLDNLGSESAAMMRIERMVAKVARTDGTVLITGESGTGKSHLARRIHKLSERADRSFVQINCGAIPENLLESEFFGHMKGAFTGADRSKKGLFHEANGGTLFLDEVFELPLALQVKLLHAIEEKEIRPVGSEQARKVDVRILAATNQDVEKKVAEGGFREDLFYRLNVMQVRLPPLRERGDDLRALLGYFVGREAARLGLNGEFALDATAEEVLLHYDWPGNLREMQNVISRALVLAEDGEIRLVDLPPQVFQNGTAVGEEVLDPGGVGNFRERVRRFEVQLIRQAIDAAAGDRQMAAKQLGIGLSTLYRKLEDFNG